MFFRLGWRNWVTQATTWGFQSWNFMPTGTCISLLEEGIGEIGATQKVTPQFSSHWNNFKHCILNYESWTACPFQLWYINVELNYQKSELTWNKLWYGDLLQPEYSDLIAECWHQSSSWTKSPSPKEMTFLLRHFYGFDYFQLECWKWTNYRTWLFFNFSRKILIRIFINVYNIIYGT